MMRLIEQPGVSGGVRDHNGGSGMARHGASSSLEHGFMDG